MADDNNKVERLQATRDSLEAEKEYIETLERSEEQQVKLVKATLKLAKAQRDLNFAVSGNKAEFGRLSIEIDKLSKDLEEAEKDFKDFAKTIEDSTAAGEGLADSLAGVIGLGDDLNTTLAGKLIKSLQEGAVSTAGFGARMTKLANPLNLASYALQSVFDETMKLAHAYDEAFVSIAKSTTSFGKLQGDLIMTERSMIGSAVGAGDLAESISSLYPVVTGFSNLDKESRRSMIMTTAVLEEMGVASATTAENIQFGTKVLGMSTKEAIGFQREMITFAEDLGVPASQVASDFEGLRGTMAALGDDGVESFRALEVQFKSTGVAAARIVSIVEQFDTFDGAAQAAGRLNALLGGPFLNSLEMVAEVDPAKRFDMLRDSLVGAGIAFDDMDYYQKKAMASALGLEDAAELALLLGDRMDLIRPPPKSAKEIEELAAQTLQFNTLMQDLAELGRAFAISLGPVVAGAKWFVTGLSGIMLAISEVSPMINGVIGMLGILAVAWAIATFPVWGLVAGLTAIMAALYAVGHFLKVKSFSPGFIDVLGSTAEAFENLGMASEVTAEQTVKLQPALEPSIRTMHQVESASNSLSSPGAVKTKVTQGSSGMGGTSAPKIEIKLQIGDQEFASKVNSVKVNGMSGGGALADSITKLLIKGLEGA